MSAEQRRFDLDYRPFIGKDWWSQCATDYNEDGTVRMEALYNQGTIVSVKNMEIKS